MTLFNFCAETATCRVFFFRLHFNVCADVDNREMARPKAKGTKNFVSNTSYTTCKAVARKWEILAAKRVKMSGSERESERNTTNKFFFLRTYDIPSLKSVTRKFPAAVVRNNVKKCTKKCAASAKLLVFPLIQPFVVLFLPFSLP